MHVVMSSRAPPPLPTDRIAKKRKVADGTAVPAASLPRASNTFPRPKVPATRLPVADLSRPTVVPGVASRTPVKSQLPPVTVPGVTSRKAHQPQNRTPLKPNLPLSATVPKRPAANAFSAASLRAAVGGKAVPRKSPAVVAPTAPPTAPRAPFRPLQRPSGRPMPLPGSRMGGAVPTGAMPKALSRSGKFPIPKVPVPKVALGGGKQLSAPRPPVLSANSTLHNARPKAKAKAKSGAFPLPPPRQGLSRIVAQPPVRPLQRRAGPHGSFVARGPPGIPRIGVRGPLRGPIRRPANPDPLGLDVMTEEDLDFIDDDDADTEDWKRELRNLTGYDPSRFAGQDEEAVESDLYKVDSEEHLSELIAKKEDREELVRLMKEARRQEDVEDEEEAADDDDEYDEEDD